MELKNYYSVLGVGQSASNRDIKEAFRVLAKKFHPDRNKAHNAKEKFIEISEAYKILINPSTRKDYDVLFDRFYKKNVEQEKQKEEHEEPLRRKKYSQAENAFKQTVKKARFSAEMDYNELLEKGLVELFYGLFRLRFVFLAVLMVLAIIILYLSWD